MKNLLKIVTVSIFIMGSAFAAETVGEKVNTATNKAVDTVKENYRDAKDKTCEMVNGKMECVSKKIKNKARTAADKIKTKAEEAKDKIDN